MSAGRMAEAGRGSTAGMLIKSASGSAASDGLECSMSDNVAVEYPQIEFVRPCNLYPHMKLITLPKFLIRCNRARGDGSRLQRAQDRQCSVLDPGPDDHGENR
jgi:hypothetical protein